MASHMFPRLQAALLGSDLSLHAGMLFVVVGWMFHPDSSYAQGFNLQSEFTSQVSPVLWGRKVVTLVRICKTIFLFGRFVSVLSLCLELAPSFGLAARTGAMCSCRYGSASWSRILFEYFSSLGCYAYTFGRIATRRELPYHVGRKIF